MSFQSKSVTLALSLAVLAALSGCDKLPGAAKPPTEAAKTVAPPAPAVAPAPEGPEGPPVTSDPDFVSGRKAEASLLKTLGQPDARKGQTLTLQRNGSASLVLTDNEESFYLLTSVMQVPTANGVQTVYVVTTHPINSPDDPTITLHDERGVAIESYAQSGLWRGSMLAIPYQEEVYSAGDVSTSSTQLRDWSTKPHRKFDFKSRCLAIEWVSDTEIKGVCFRPIPQEGREVVGEEETDAVFTRVGPNAWRLRELRAPKAKLLDVENNPPTAYDETVKGVAYSGDQ